jgi:hypothetical protein
MRVASTVKIAGVATKAKRISHRNQSLLPHLPLNKSLTSKKQLIKLIA